MVGACRAHTPVGDPAKNTGIRGVGADSVRRPRGGAGHGDGPIAAPPQRIGSALSRGSITLPRIGGSAGAEAAAEDADYYAADSS